MSLAALIDEYEDRLTSLQRAIEEDSYTQVAILDKIVCESFDKILDAVPESVPERVKLTEFLLKQLVSDSGQSHLNQQITQKIIDMVSNPAAI